MTETWRPLLETCAYNILGSREEARDVVQDVFVRLAERPIDHIENKKAYLLRAVVNRAINARERLELTRKAYRGSWLPEPVATGSADNELLQKDILTYSMMVLLERLTASERAVFILREGFSYSHDEIADALDLTAAASRQLLRRAKLRLKDAAGPKLAAGPAAGPAAHPEDPPEGKVRLQRNVRRQQKQSAFRTDQFLSAIRNREIAHLEKLLSEDIVITSDGGGKVLANRIPVAGRAKAIKYLLGVYEKYQRHNDFVPALINHQPALLHFQGDQLVSCEIFEFDVTGVRAIYFVRNPDKLVTLSSPGLSL